jgi:hypothetical protein
VLLNAAPLLEEQWHILCSALSEDVVNPLRLHGSGTGARFATDNDPVNAFQWQCVPLTVDVDRSRVAVLDALRRQRNAADYTGDDVDATVTENCIMEAA